MNHFQRNNLLEVAKRNGVLAEPDVRKLVLAAGLSSNKYLQNSALKAVLGRSVERWSYPFDSGDFAGGLKLGRCFDGQSFNLSEQDLAKHFLAVGQSGAGKTTLFYSLMDEVKVPFWAFDLKQDYRYLDSVLVLPWTELKFNPLKPPEEVPPRRWAQVFSEIFSHATALLSGSKNYLMKKVIELYRLYNLFETVSEPYPSLHELEMLIKSDGISYMRKQSGYRDTLLNRLEAMNLVAGTVFDCSSGYSVSKLLEKDVVFEFDGLSRDVQNFLMEILFAYVYEHRLSKNQRDQGLNHLFFLDEGKRVFSVYKERQDASGIPEIDELTAKMREFGEGLIVADQEASKLTDSIKANTYTKALLPTADRKQFNAVAGSMNLSERQTEFAHDIEVGEAIIQVGNHSPVPVNLRNRQVQKTRTDRELERSQRGRWNRLSYEQRKTTSQFDDVVAGEDRSPLEKGVPDDPTEIELSDDATRMLEDVVENQFKPLSERYDTFSSSYKGNSAKTQLVDKGVVVERRVGAGEKRKLLQLTEKGRDHAEQELDLDTEQTGRGGIVHRYWQHKIRETFEDAGWQSFVEKFDADVYVNMGTAELAVEVAMGNNPREIRHIEKHLDSEFLVWVVCRNTEILNGLKQRMKENGLDTDSVVFRLFRHFSDSELSP